jgi:IclR family transcriptional regulator, acetate operon repressor
MSARQRSALLDNLALTRYTANTLTQRASLDAELETIRREGHAVDAEEFVDGLVCVAVPVLAAGGRQVRCALALQAPAARMTLAQARLQLPRLQLAAQALARTLG